MFGYSIFFGVRDVAALGTVRRYRVLQSLLLQAGSLAKSVPRHFLHALPSSVLPSRVATLRLTNGSMRYPCP
jgi:hypothetical protein